MTRSSILGQVAVAAVAASLVHARADEHKREFRRGIIPDAKQRKLVEDAQRPIIRVPVEGEVTELVVPVIAGPQPHAREQQRHHLQQLAVDAKREAIGAGASPRQARRAARRARRLGQVDALNPDTQSGRTPDIAEAAAEVAV